MGKQGCTQDLIDQGRPAPLNVMLETANGDLIVDTVVDLQVPVFEENIAPYLFSLSFGVHS